MDHHRHRLDGIDCPPIALLEHQQKRTTQTSRKGEEYMMEDFASAVLYQDHIAVVLLLIAGGFLIKLLPFRFPKAFGNSKMFAFVNFVAAIVILLGSINLGYKLSDDDWGRNSVNKQKQETINKLQQDLARRR